MFERTIGARIIDKVNSGKAIVVVGARQVGKTTLLKEILNENNFFSLTQMIAQGQMKPCRRIFRKFIYPP